MQGFKVEKEVERRRKWGVMTYPITFNKWASDPSALLVRGAF